MTVRVEKKTVQADIGAAQTSCAACILCRDEHECSHPCVKDVINSMLLRGLLVERLAVPQTLDLVLDHQLPALQLNNLQVVR
jgi:hypothetical protein